MQVTQKSNHILAHRGLWTDPNQANSTQALTGALEEGFGIETDLRDLAGQVVVSHDPAAEGAPLFIGLLETWLSLGVLKGASLALNVKSDGLAPLLDRAGPVLRASAHYFFDMSFPQLRTFTQLGLPVALRASEFEPIPRDLALALDVEARYWVDGFESDWWLGNRQMEEACRQAQITLVSPEIHGRDPEPTWVWFAELLAEGYAISICTDRPFDVLAVIS